MERVQRRLVAGIGMDRRHDPLLDADGVVEDLRDRREAIGRAGGVRDDVVLLGLVARVVDAEDQRDVFVFRRRRDDRLLRTRVEVRADLVAVGEDARRFDDDVHP